MKTIGIDTGGTFTDLAVHDDTSGQVHIAKVPSTPNDPAAAVERLLGQLADGYAGARVVHGTTVATNALLEAKGAQVAIVNTRGFRDLIEIGRTRRVGPGLFNTKFVKPPPIVPRPWRFELDERLLADGSVLRPLSRESLEQVINGLLALDPDVVVVCLLHSYCNPAHEIEAGEAIRQRLNRAKVELSHELVMQHREFERLSTAVINGFVLPKMAGYLERLGNLVSAQDGKLHVMGSNGGIMSAPSAARQPIRTILSGPAAGVSGALRTCRDIGITDFITCDMGGTSTDVSLVVGSSPTMVQETTIAHLPLRLPQLDINSVGAGGGSIAWVDVDGGLRVGPQSAGADPGPACYGRGGDEFTVTDANLLLGRLGEMTLLGGEMQVNRGAAQRSLTRLATLSGYSGLDRLAAGIIRMAVIRMVSAIREISVERGHDPRRFSLVAFGGAGPLHAAEIADEFGIERIVIPSHPGNLSAIGLTGANIRHDYAVNDLRPCTADELALVGKRFDELREQGIRQLTEDEFGRSQIRIERALDLRYRGQAFELTVPYADDDSEKSIADSFASLYAKRYSFNPTSRPIDIVTLRLTATGLVPPPTIGDGWRGDGAEPQSSERRIYLAGQWHDKCPVLQRRSLAPDWSAPGPMIIEEFGSTTLVPENWRATVDRTGNLLMSLMQEEV